MIAFLVITAIACVFWTALAVGTVLVVGTAARTRDRRG